MSAPKLRLANIQGNILGGFFKDYQAFVHILIPDAKSGRAWLAGTVRDIATSDDVLAFNRRFKRTKKQHRGEDKDNPYTATWVNVAFTHKGLAALGAPAADLDAFPTEFKAGMAARAGLLGDLGESAPENWIPPLRGGIVDAVLLVAADREEDYEREVRRQKQRLGKFGLQVPYIQHARVRPGAESGHEHFGFKDGIAQPGVIGIPGSGPRPDACIQPGEFVLGYPTESSPDQPPPVRPAWAADGSFLVLRRLRQDVQGFRNFVCRQAGVESISKDLMGAKLVGRYESGAPLELTGDQPNDPGVRNPKLLDDARINAFSYAADSDGLGVPRAAHIRKVNPRDSYGNGAGNSRNRRLLRRAVPFGDSFQEDAPPGSRAAGEVSFPDDRGLVFVCYQSSIAEQFEWVQWRMVNNPDFPRVGDGEDPLISQAQGSFTLPGGAESHVALMKRFVTTTGGDYFFSPSISALREMAGQRKGRGASMADSGYMTAFQKFVAAVWAEQARRPLQQPKAGALGPHEATEYPLANTSIPVGGAIPNPRIADALNGAAPEKQTAQYSHEAWAGTESDHSKLWRNALKEFGIPVPDNREVQVHINDQRTFHYVVPQAPDLLAASFQSLAQEALDALCCAC